MTTGSRAEWCCDTPHDYAVCRELSACRDMWPGRGAIVSR
nr:MAG TPA: hypothetical protein [Caudoviricetes sp.]